jgi:hypothetical protein
MSAMFPLISLLHLLSTAVMVGVIWIVQLTHYPTFRFIDSAKFKPLVTFHCRSINFIVLPSMLLEASTGALLLFSGERSTLFLISLFILLVIWASTFLIQVPLHERLKMGADYVVIEELISSNWIRTVGWSVRIILLIIFCRGL